MQSRFGKKGVESHIVILLVISIVMTLFITFILGSLYGEEHRDCKDISFEIKNQCKKGELIEFSIKNTGDKVLRFQLNGVQNDIYEVSVKSEQKYNFQLKSEDNLKILPYLKINGEIFECSGRSEKIKTEVLLSC